MGLDLAPIPPIIGPKCVRPVIFFLPVTQKVTHMYCFTDGSGDNNVKYS